MSDALAPSIARPVPNPMNVALFNQALRDHKLSIEQCAAQIGVGRNTPRRWQNGVVPLLPAAQRLAALLELEVNDLWPQP
jgi:transcriptional regulator with XRE-family HTH domain